MCKEPDLYMLAENQPQNRIYMIHYLILNTDQVGQPEQEPSNSLSVAPVHVHKHWTFKDRGNSMYEFCSGMEFHIH